MYETSLIRPMSSYKSQCLSTNLIVTFYLLLLCLLCDLKSTQQSQIQQQHHPALSSNQVPLIYPPTGGNGPQVKSHVHHQSSINHNFSHQSTRPLDRPSLTLVNKNHHSPDLSSSPVSFLPPRAGNHSMGAQPEGAADWFMLGADDLSTGESKTILSGMFADGKQSKKHSDKRNKSSGDQQSDSSDTNEIFDDSDEALSLAGTQKEPECAQQGRYYCTYKEDYPLKLVTEVTKYYKWPLEKLFRDLNAQTMPKLAQDSSGNLVCDSITRVVRPGWARNTNDRWLVVINTENYHQYVTEVVCQYGSNSRCNFIPPCYYSSCQQRYNTQKLLVIDPTNPYRGPFLSEFLFPSCCVCYVPSSSESFQDRYRPSPATIYQRTMQQDSSNNIYPPQFKPIGLLDETLTASMVSSSNVNGATNNAANKNQKFANQAPDPGEIRRAGDQYGNSNADARGPSGRGEQRSRVETNQ